jgi:hypothetical protein
MVAKQRRPKAPIKSPERKRPGIEEDLERAKQKASQKYLSTPHPLPRASRRLISADPVHNVVGVGIGPKRVEKNDTETLCVRLYVRNKFPKGRIAKRHALPAMIGGFPTDIIEVGSPRLIANGISFERMRPARPGCAIAAAADTEISAEYPGTFGALVQDLAGKLYVLSNNHVLAVEGLCEIGTSIFQPGGPAVADRIGKLAAVIPFGRAPRRTDVDCALAAVGDASKVNGSPLAPVGPLSSAAPIDPQVGMVVEKFGATTGHTLGTITDIGADFQIEYMTGTVFLDDQIQISDGAAPFCSFGDSGSLVVDTASKQATGLLAINMGGFALANHLSVVLAKLGAHLGSALQLKIS